MFNAIYEQNMWRYADGSGHGSAAEYNTGLLRTLPRVLERLGVRVLIDVGCGSCVWTERLLQTMSMLTYHGVDIATLAVERARRRFEPFAPRATFTVADACKDALPRGDVQAAVLCRDTLQHLTPEDAVAALRRLADTGAGWIIVGGYIPGRNRRVGPAYHYNINLSQAPFSLPPEWVYSEDNDPSDPHKHLFVFSGDTLRATDWGALAARVAAFDEKGPSANSTTLPTTSRGGNYF